jgi:hypothetical protein
MKNAEWRLTYDWALLSLHTCPPFITSKEPNVSHHDWQFLYHCMAIRCHGNVCYSILTLWFSQAHPLPLKRVLASRCLVMDVSTVLLWRYNSDVQVPRHNIQSDYKIPLYKIAACLYIALYSPNVLSHVFRHFIPRLLLNIMKMVLGDCL